MKFETELRNRLADAFAMNESAASDGRAASIVLQGPGVPGWLDHEAAGGLAASLFDLHGVTDVGLPLFVLRAGPSACETTVAAEQQPSVESSPAVPPSRQLALVDDIRARTTHAFDSDARAHRFLASAIRTLGYQDTTLNNVLWRLHRLNVAELERVSEKLDIYEHAHRFAGRGEPS